MALLQQVHRSGRFLNIFDYALSSLMVRFYRNILVFAVFSLVVFLFSSFQLMTRGVTDLATRTLATAPDITVQKMSAGRQVSLPVADVKTLGSIYGVQSVFPRVWGYYFDESNGANYCVVGLDMRDQPSFTGLTAWAGLKEGRMVTADDRGKVIISEHVRASLQLGGRKRFSLFRPDLSQIPFETAGVFDNSLDAVTADFILMNIEDARDLFAIKKHLVTDLLVSVANPVEIQTIANKINERLDGVRVITRNQMEKTYRVVFGWRSGLGTICLISSLMAFIVLAWDKATGFSKEEEREAVILKIVGWQTKDIILLRLLESVSISVLGFFTGYLLAWVHVGLFDGLLFRPVLLGWSVLKPEFSVLPPFVGSDLLLVFSLAVVPYLSATLVPAWRASTVKYDLVI